MSLAEMPTEVASTPIPQLDTSAAIDQLIPALIKAQAAITPALKVSENPHFHSRYADLATVIETCKGPLNENGFFVGHPMRPLANGQIEVSIILIHTSGQWIRSVLPLSPELRDPQKIGSFLTYARRYLLCSLLEIPTEDDDAESASGRGPQQQRGQQRNGQQQGQREQRPTSREESELRAWAAEFVTLANQWWARWFKEQGKELPRGGEKILTHGNHLLNHLAKWAHETERITLPQDFRFEPRLVAERLAPVFAAETQVMEAEAWHYVKSDRPKQIKAELGRKTS